MPPTQGMAEFFAMEAGEYLERLDALISPAGTPNGDEFVRLARALRGSALMANQQSIAGAAGGLEALARGIRESRLPWDAANRQIAIRSVDDLKVLIRSLRTWSPAEDAKARAMAQELEQLAGTRAPGRPAGRAPDAGTRALVAREGTALATELVRLAVALSQNPGGTALAGTALKVMQPLRGVAGLNDLPPLPDILEGVERAVGEVTRRPTAAGAAAAVFRAAAQALSRAAKEAAAGPVTSDTPELTEFAMRLRQLIEPAGEAVPIESLYYADGGPHVLEAGKAPVGARPGTIGRVELVSHGEHIKQVSDELQRATSAAQRDLRAQSLTATLRSLAAAGGAVTAFAAAAHEAVTRAASLPDPTALVTGLRDAGTLLAHATSADDPGLGEALTRIASSLRSQTASAPRAPTRAVAAPASAAAPAPAPAAPARRASGGTAAALEETADLAGTFLRYARLNATIGAGASAIGDFLAGPPGMAAAPGPSVSLADLTYSGPAALQRAMSLQEDIRAALRPGGNSAKLPDLLEEVFDLVKLGLPRGS